MKLSARPWRRLGKEEHGSVLIETAFVAPVLVIMCLGGFEVGSIVAKQNRLQAAAELATEIVLVSEPDTPDEGSDIEEELQASLPASAAVDVTFKYRCGTAAMADAAGTCDEDLLSTYIHIAVTDTYTPTWTEFGFGQTIEYDVQRTVQVS
ncbi:TadE/TadG family type IV pilus assembly protein [Tsuneonella sp. HG249]